MSTKDQSKLENKMSYTKESHSTDEHGNVTQVNYTETRPDGKTETRHYNPTVTEQTGRTVSDNEGNSEHYSPHE